MKRERKPLKRNKHLVKLSHEHHEGLVFASRLKRGIDKGTPVSILRDYTLGFWNNYLEPHFLSKEKNLLPFLPETNAFAQRLIHEHIIIRELIRRTRQTPSDIENFSRLSIALTEHLRFEEWQLLPFAETYLTSTQPKEVSKSLKHEVPPYIFEPEFWNK